MISAFRVDQVDVRVHADPDELATAAATEFARVAGEQLSVRDEIAVMFATGNSQLALMAALRARDDIAWSRIHVFHLDEYLGISAGHPASFRRYLRDELVDVVHPREFHAIAGDTADPEAEARRYAGLLRAHMPSIAVMGIGENGHLAFNDPPADFEHPRDVHVVRLDDASRRQQVGEGHFPSVDETPDRALTVSVPALLRPERLLVVVPERRKAEAVRAALSGPVSPQNPASALRRCAGATLYLEPGSASALDLGALAPRSSSSAR